jgi:hypothetical protein
MSLEAALNRRFGGDGWSTWDSPPSKPRSAAASKRASATLLPPSVPGRRFMRAHRMARHRDRRQKGLRWITIKLREAEFETLIRRRRLARDSRGHLAAVRKALCGFFDDHLR